jgi:hypothetical protein
MGSYDTRRITLDPGLTVLALRTLRYEDRHYPFTERRKRWRERSRFVRALLSARLPKGRGISTARSPI